MQWYALLSTHFPRDGKREGFYYQWSIIHDVMSKGARYFTERMTSKKRFPYFLYTTVAVLIACLNNESLDKALLGRTPRAGSVNLDTAEVLGLRVLHAVVLLAVNQDTEHEPALA